MLFVGDVHATMGDGEVSGSGLGVAAQINLSLSHKKGGAPHWPWLETENLLVTMASGPTFDAAAEIAIREMLDLLLARYSLSKTDA